MSILAEQKDDMTWLRIMEDEHGDLKILLTVANETWTWTMDIEEEELVRTSSGTYKFGTCPKCGQALEIIRDSEEVLRLKILGAIKT